MVKIGMIGNPNCGKSTLFNALTGSNQDIGNWSGVTIDIKKQVFNLKNTMIELNDLPGIYSLQPNNSNTKDENITLQYIEQRDFDYIINVIDASNIERSLYITIQMLEKNIPVILVLNKYDLLQGKFIDIDLLSKSLGNIPIFITNSTQKRTLAKLKDFLNYLDNYKYHHVDLYKEYLPLDLQMIIRKNHENAWNITSLIEQNTAVSCQQILTPNIKQIVHKYTKQAGLVISGARYKFIKSVLKNSIATKVASNNGSNIDNILDNVFLHKWLGIPMFLLIMYIVFVFSIVIGGVFQDFFEQTCRIIFKDIISHLMTQLHIPKLIIEIFGNGIGEGIATVATFVPIIFCLYLALSFLEESGYIARAAFLIHKWMKLIGLPGKSLIPLIIGFGCNVPSIMSTRIIDNKADRIATIMMSPFMSCSARLSLYATFCVIFFPNNGQNIVFLLYFIGIIVAIFTGALFKKFLKEPTNNYFMIELPKYSLPNLKDIILRSYYKLRSFIFNAGKLIIIAFLIISIIQNITIKEEPAIAYISKKITPIFYPIGINDDNWPATLSIITGILAKELVVGSLKASYNYNTEPSNSDDFLLDIKKAFFTILQNTQKIAGNITNPVWLNISDMESDSNNYYKTYMQNLFGNKVAVFSYLLFILLYFPCISVFAIIARELSKVWAVISAMWSTVVSYTVTTWFYQISTYIFFNTINLSYLLYSFTILLCFIIWLKTYLSCIVK